MLTRTQIALAVALAVGVNELVNATEYVILGLYARVQGSDTIVIARVTDADRAVMTVERVLKGRPPKQITLISYIDPMIVAYQRKLLLPNTRELLFLNRKGDGYAPVQTQNGRLRIDGGRLIDSFAREPLDLSRTLSSIERLVPLQSRAARSDRDADAAFVSALKSDDVEVQSWALWTVKDRLRSPSPELADAILARWPRRAGPDGSWEAAGNIANISNTWRIQRWAPFFARILSTSAQGPERSAAAMALGGTGDRAYVPLLRRVAIGDSYPWARALAFSGIIDILGPESLPDIRLGAKDADEHVRAQVVVDSYNMLELSHPEPRRPAPSSELIADVRSFLAEMLDDPAPLVSNNARSMLNMIAVRRPAKP
jgi:hypothetical protein